MDKYLIVFKNNEYQGYLAPNLNLDRNIVIKGVPENANYLFVEDENFNFDVDEFFNAIDFDWSLPNGSSSDWILNLEKAKSIFINKLRYYRDPLFAPLDVQFIRAIEQGDQTIIAEVTAKKQELRDITQMDLSSATDLTSLKQLWPTSILGESPF